MPRTAVVVAIVAHAGVLRKGPARCAAPLQRAGSGRQRHAAALPDQAPPRRLKPGEDLHVRAIARKLRQQAKGCAERRRSRLRWRAEHDVCRGRGGWRGGRPRHRSTRAAGEAFPSLEKGRGRQSARRTRSLLLRRLLLLKIASRGGSHVDAIPVELPLQRVLNGSNCGV